MEKTQARIYEFGEFRVDANSRLRRRRNDSAPEPLTPKVFDTLLYLVERAGENELMREIWTDTIVEENNLNKNISVLRRVLGEKHGENRYIATIPGRGYKFVAEVRRREEEEKGRKGDEEAKGAAGNTDLLEASLPPTDEPIRSESRISNLKSEISDNRADNQTGNQTNNRKSAIENGSPPCPFSAF